MTESCMILSKQRRLAGKYLSDATQGAFLSTRESSKGTDGF